MYKYIYSDPNIVAFTAKIKKTIPIRSCNIIPLAKIMVLSDTNYYP